MNILIQIIFLAYQFFIFQVFSLGTYGVTSLDLAAIIFYLFFLFKKIIWDGEPLKFHWNNSLFFLLGFIFAVLLSGVNPLYYGSNPVITQFFKTSLHFLFIISFTMICTFYRIDIKILNNIIRVWLMFSILVNSYAVYQLFARAFDFPLGWLPVTNITLGARGFVQDEGLKQLALHWESFFRATSIFYEPSSLAGFNNFTLLLLIVPFIQHREPFIKKQWLNVIVLIGAIIGLFVSFSLMGFLLIIVQIILMFILEWNKRILTFFYVLLSSIVFILILDISINLTFNTSILSLFEQRVSGIFLGKSKKKEGTEGESYFTRVKNIKMNLKIWEENPLTGTGLGLMSFHTKREIMFSDVTVFAVMTETGVIGLILFLGIFFYLFKYSLRFIFQKISYEKLSEDLKRFNGLLLYMMVYHFFVNFFWGNQLVANGLWLLISLVFAIINITGIELNQNVKTIHLMSNPFKSSFISALNKFNEQAEK